MIRLSSLRRLLPALLLSAFALAGQAQNAPVGDRDARFLRQAAENSRMEVEAGRIALRQSKHPKVLAFARTMVDMHTRAGEELAALAKQKDVTLDDDPSLVQRAELKSLSTLDGRRFDHNYARTVGENLHEKNRRMFEDAARGAEDPEIRAWAAKQLPALKKHQTDAYELKRLVPPRP